MSIFECPCGANAFVNGICRECGSRAILMDGMTENELRTDEEEANVQKGKWQREIPKTPGWYWFRDRFTPDPIPARVSLVEEEGCFECFCLDHAEQDHEWFGAEDLDDGEFYSIPIPTPED